MVGHRLNLVTNCIKEIDNKNIAVLRLLMIAILIITDISFTFLILYSQILVSTNIE